MVSKTLLSALWLACQTSALALPARTHCRCTTIDAARSQLTTQSQSPSDFPHISSSSPQDDICTTLGPELENFRHSQPQKYADFISSSSLNTEIAADPTSTDEEKPLSTTVLLQLAVKGGFQNLGVVLPSKPTERPRERIVCRAERQAFEEGFGETWFTLLALQIIVAIAVLACVFEGVMLAKQWWSARRSASEDVPVPTKPALRLSGDEKLLRAFPSVEIVFSPGAEKKLHAYSSADWTPRTPSKMREFEAYVESDDDESSRPVL